MNDFTKEELYKIFEWGMSLADAFPDCFGEEDTSVYIKVQSMIENYCEHDCKETIIFKVATTSCSKCGYIK